MSGNRASAWIRVGTPAAVSVVLGVVAGISVSGATTGRPGLSAVIGAVATVAAWALWEARRAVRDSQEDPEPDVFVTQSARQVRGRLTGWAGPLAGRRGPVRTRQQIGTVEQGGEVIGIDVRSYRDPPPPG